MKRTVALLSAAALVALPAAMTAPASAAQAEATVSGCTPYRA